MLLAVVIGATFFMPRSRITQANFDRIQKGMSREEVWQILGQYTDADFWGEIADNPGVYKIEIYLWEERPDYITVTFAKSLDSYLVVNKDIHLGTPWEQIKWRCGLGEWLWDW